MIVSTVLNAHGHTELVLDTLDSIKTFLGDNVLVVVDGAMWDTWGNQVKLPAHKIRGFDHNFNRAPYRNLTYGLKTIYDMWPNSNWFCYCFRGNTLVETIDGPKKISDIKENDLVKTHLGRFRKVTHKFDHVLKQKTPLIWIETKNNIIKCTPEHPFLISRNDVTEFFCPASSLKEGDRLLYPDNHQNDNITFNIKFNKCAINGNGKKNAIKNGDQLTTIPLTNKIARFMGLYLAEGNSYRDGIMFTFNNNEHEYIEFIENMTKVLFNRTPTKRIAWATQLRINVRSLKKLFDEWFGTKAYIKKIPEFVFGWSFLHKLQFINGYLEGDGHIDKNKRLIFTTASPFLVEDLLKLVNSCGLNFKFCKQKPHIHIYKNSIINSKISYHASFDKKSSNKFWDLLESKFNNGYLEIPIKSILHKKMPALAEAQRHVYNLEVEEDNSYIADCAAVHNCEYDALFTSNRILEDLRIANEQNIWCLGNDLRIADMKFPYLENILDIKLNQSYYLLGCCVFHHQKFIKKLAEEKFFDKFLMATNEFTQGYFPDYEEQGGYDFGEHLYPTLANYYGGSVAQFAVWNQFLEQWNGTQFKKYPMRWKPEITWEDNFSEAVILHPLKEQADLRMFHATKRMRAKCTTTK